MDKASKYYGLKIVDAKFSESKISLEFENGKRIEIFDDGQCCCESRYLTTDDDIHELVGKSLTKIETKEGPSIVDLAESDEKYLHETMFLEIWTNSSVINITAHNGHNGYYGGFCPTIEEKKGEE